MNPWMPRWLREYLRDRQRAEEAIRRMRENAKQVEEVRRGSAASPR